MWKLDCASKIKHLLWSLAHNSLAVRKNICRWILIPDVLYAGDLTKMAGKLFEVQVCEEMLERTKFGAYSATICGSGIGIKCGVVQHALNLQENIRISIIRLLWAWWDARNKANAGKQLRADGRQYILYRANCIGVELTVYRRARQHGLS